METLQKKVAINLSNTDKVILDQEEQRQGIEVVCRIRPQFQTEQFVKYVINNNKLEIQEKGMDNEIQNSKTYNFTHIYDQDTNQNEVQMKHVIPLIKDIFQKNKGALLFSYGVTNSGKTFTIIGNNQNPGILPQSLQCLESIKQQFQSNQQEIKLLGETISIENQHYVGCKLTDINYSFKALEIYNEEIYDLLGSKTKLQLKEVSERRYEVKEAVDVQLDDNYAALLNKALQNRQMGETTLNSQSSRSHTIFKVTATLTYQNQSYSVQERCNFCVVDLAGSERSKKAETQGHQLTEACNINKSLLVLGKCLKQMRCVNDIEQNRIPFRECKLTRLLSEYFSDDNRILMIINVRLTKEDLDETLKVLHYGALSVHVNLLKAKIYQSTICSANHQETIKDKKNKNEERDIKISKDIIRKAKLLVQNTTNNMLFQQQIEDDAIERKLLAIRKLSKQLSELTTNDQGDHYHQSFSEDGYQDIPEIESGKRLNASLERLKTEKQSQNFESRMSSLKKQQSEQQQSEPKDCQSNMNHKIQEEEQDKEQDIFNENNNNINNNNNNINNNNNDNDNDNDQDENGNYNEKQNGTPTKEEYSNLFKIDNYTNTTPFDQMKQNLVNQFLNGQEFNLKKQETEDFKNEILKNLSSFYNDSKDEGYENDENNQNLQNSSNLQQAKMQNISDKFLSNSKLKVIEEQEREHDSIEQVPKKKNSKKGAKKKGRSKRRCG